MERHGRVHFLWPLLLGPVAAARQNGDVSQVRHEASKVGYHLVRPAPESDDKISIAGDVERGTGRTESRARKLVDELLPR